MPEAVLEIRALTPLLFRDGRPFPAAEGSETHARSWVLPPPSTLAGFVRTQVGLAQGKEFATAEELFFLRDIPVYGPLLVQEGEFLFPAPKDAVVYPDERGYPQTMRLRPFRPPEGAGCNLPEGLLPLKVDRDVKPASGYAFWSAGEMEGWLLGEEVLPSRRPGPPEEVRVHVAIDPQTGKAAEGQLFSVAYRVLEEKKSQGGVRTLALRARVSLPHGAMPAPLGHLGGERRPVAVRVLEGLSQSWWDPPARIRERFRQLDEAVARGEKARVRLVLATPGLFREGWKPGWLEAAGTGALHLPRGLAKVRLRLVAAAVGRREAISGWSLRENRPKPVRWAVPAGSVYFFEVEEGKPSHLLESWLRPVSDAEVDRKDGFGLALWGVW